MVKFSVKFDGMAKLNRSKKASNKDEAQTNRSILKIIHEGVVDLKDLIDFTKKEFGLKLSISKLLIGKFF